jgi:hypothetical protein
MIFIWACKNITYSKGTMKLPLKPNGQSYSKGTMKLPLKSDGQSYSKGTMKLPLKSDEQSYNKGTMKLPLKSDRQSPFWPSYYSRTDSLIIKEQWSFPWTRTGNLLFDLSYYSIHKENRHTCGRACKRANDQERQRARQ